MVVLLPRVLKDGVEENVNSEENIIYVQVLVLHAVCILCLEGVKVR